MVVTDFIYFYCVYLYPEKTNNNYEVNWLLHIIEGNLFIIVDDIILLILKSVRIIEACKVSVCN